MKWSFDGPNGGVTVRQDGERVICQAIGGIGRAGLYKAWLQGPAGKILLGTLIPEGGTLRLRRVMEVSQLEARCGWPPTGAEISLVGAEDIRQEKTGGWQWAKRPEKMVGDREVAQMLRGLGQVLYKKEKQGFLFAIPYSLQRPYPLTALFCLSTLGQINGQWYAIFSFSPHGYPQLMHNFSDDGENRKGT